MKMNKLLASIKNRFRNDSRSSKNNEKGFTLVEMVFSSSILLLIMPLVFSLAVTALKVKDVSSVSTSNTLAHSGFDEILRNDVENASFIQVPASNNKMVYIEVGDQCKIWELVPTGASKHTLQYSSSSSDVSNVSNVLYENVIVSDSAIPTFTYDGRMLKYKIKLGVEANTQEYNGSVLVKTYQQPNGSCPVV